MHFLNTTYTIYFNKKHERCGHLFQGRYRSILIEAESYAKVLSKYIHLNPVRAEIVDLPEKYLWSSYGYYRGASILEKWLEVDLVLSMFGGRSDSARQAYVEFVREGIGKEVPPVIRDSVRKGILGSDEFVERIIKEHFDEGVLKPDREKPQLRKLRTKVDPSLVISVTERVLGPRNRFVVPIAVLISHKNSALKLKEIGDVFGLTISSVSNASSRARAAIASNPSLARAAEEIEREIVEAGDREARRCSDGVKPTFFRKK
jgi:hypothetical protein